MESPATRTLSPKEFAQVIGVSQSSIKRWVDDGLIEVTRTAGGHRRIPVRAAVRFVRLRGMHVVRPELLGLPGVANLPLAVADGAVTGDDLFELLTRGASSDVSSFLSHLYANGQRLGAFFDGPLAEALKAIGELWLQGEEGIYLEHRATANCIEALSQLRLLMPVPPGEAPVVIGGAPAGDSAVLPSLMAATVLRDVGFNDVNLGPNLPVGALLSAIEAHDPVLVWLSLTSHLALPDVERYLKALLDDSQGRDWQLLVGGRHVAQLAPSWSDRAILLGSLSELETSPPVACSCPPQRFLHCPR